MNLGARLYYFSKRRHMVAISLLAAVAATVVALYQVSLLPPGLHSRKLSIGTAATEMLVASPNLAVGGSAYQYSAAVNQAILLGNVMVSEPVLNDVSLAIGVPVSRIQATAPMTANVPRSLVEPGSGASATAILKSPDLYKLEIQADPSVPILHIYSQAPSAAVAVRIANAAVQGVNTYLQGLEVSDRIPVNQRIRVEELGPVQAGVANPGAPTQIAVLVFLGVFGVSLWLLAITAKIRRGWALARLKGQLQL